MEHARLGEVDIAFEVRGDGPPVLFIHGAFIADALRPLAEESTLAGFQIIQWHRRGYGDSHQPGGDLRTNVNDAIALLDHLGIPSAHVLAHSSGGAIALQLAASHPGRVNSLTLLEPLVPGAVNAAAVGEAFPKIIGPYFEGRHDEGVERFFRLIMGDDARAAIEAGVGTGIWDKMLIDAHTAFESDFVIFGTLAFGPQEAAAIQCPVLFVLGENSVVPNRVMFAEVGMPNPDVDMFGEMIDAGMSLLPQAEMVKVPGVDHGLQMRDAGAIANAVAPFLAKNRDAVSA